MARELHFHTASDEGTIIDPRKKHLHIGPAIDKESSKGGEKHSSPGA